MTRNQQEIIYTAEYASGVEGRRFADRDEIQVYVDRELVDTDWWAERYGHRIRDVEVGKTAPRSLGSCGHYVPADLGGYMEMGDCHFFERPVLHEVAHIIAGAMHGSVAHDPWFARIYLELVFRMIGADAWAALRGSFVEHGVQFDTREFE